MQPSARASRGSTGARRTLSLVVLAIFVGGLVLGAAILFVMALGSLIGVGVLCIFVAMAAYTLWTHETAAEAPRRGFT